MPSFEPSTVSRGSFWAPLIWGFVISSALTYYMALITSPEIRQQRIIYVGLGSAATGICWKKISQQVGKMGSASLIGGFISYPVGGIMVDQVGYTYALVAYPGLLLASVIILIVSTNS